MAGPTFTFTKCPDTFYIRSTDGGGTWDTEVNVANSGAAIAGRNDVAVAGTSSVVINFNRATENTADANPHLFVVRSTNDGATWGMPVQLTNTPGTSDHGSIVGYGSSVHLAWHDSRDGKLGVYYVYSTDEGSTWKADERVSPTTTPEASTPLDAVTPGFVHLVWLDKRSGSYQVYYRRRVAPIADAIDGGASSDGGTANGDGGSSGPFSDPVGPTASDGSGSSDGCGCRFAGAPRVVLVPTMFALVAVLIVRARRRRP
jgi:hypothetical protein